MTDRRLRIAIAVLALAGVGIATYLTFVHYADVKPFCVAGAGNCQKVQTSDYAELAGIPVAVLGVIGYVLILGSLFVPGENGVFAGAILALSGFAFSVYLTYRELFTIDAICQYCVGSAVLMTALAALTVWRLLRLDEPGTAAT